MEGKFCWINPQRVCAISCTAAHGTAKDGVIRDDLVQCRLLSTLTKLGKLFAASIHSTNIKN